MVVVRINGLMVGNLLVSGRIIRCMEKEYLLGLTAECIKAIMKMTKSTVWENSSGQMEETTKVNGELGSNMVRGDT